MKRYLLYSLLIVCTFKLTYTPSAVLVGVELLQSSAEASCSILETKALIELRKRSSSIHDEFIKNAIVQNAIKKYPNALCQVLNTKGIVELIYKSVDQFSYFILHNKVQDAIERYSNALCQFLNTQGVKQIINRGSIRLHDIIEHDIVRNRIERYPGALCQFLNTRPDARIDRSPRARNRCQFLNTRSHVQIIFLCKAFSNYVWQNMMLKYSDLFITLFNDFRVYRLLENSPEECNQLFVRFNALTELLVTDKMINRVMKPENFLVIFARRDPGMMGALRGLGRKCEKIPIFKKIIEYLY